MLSLLSPGWLWGLGALALPIAIHLLSRGSSPRLALGTVRFLDGSPTRSVRKVRLTDWALLAARCLALALLALALAEPVFLRSPESSAPGRLLVDPELSGPVLDAEVEEVVRERLAQGWEIRWLAPGFPPLDPASPADRTESARVAGGNWSLAAEAAWTQSPGTPLELVTSDLLTSVSGRRPRLPEWVTWRTFPSDAGGEPVRWIERVRRQDGEITGAVVGTSDGSGVGFARVSANEFVVTETDTGPKATLRSSGEDLGGFQWEALDGPSRLRVLVSASEERRADAAYVEAGLRALSDTASMDVTISSDGSAGLSEAGEAFDLVFWLNADEAPEALLSGRGQGAVVVSDAGPLHEACLGRVEVDGGAFETLRCDPPRNDAMEGVWRDQGGRPLLLRARPERAGESPARYRLASRFHPEWTSLVHSEVFLRFLQGLLHEAGANETGAGLALDRDRSVLAREYMAPATGENEFPSRRTPDRTPETLTWLALVATLVGERWLARGGAG